MNTGRKIAIGLSLAGGAVLAAWLLTGDRKQRTKDFVVRNAQSIKDSMRKKEEEKSDDYSEIHYI